MKDWQKRVVEENAALQRKIDALSMFLNHDAGRNLSAEEHNLLVAQREAMQQYADILVRRISYFGEKK